MYSQSPSLPGEQIAQQVLTTLNLKQWPGTDKLIKLNWASASSRGTREEYSVYVGDLSPEVNVLVVVSERLSSEVMSLLLCPRELSSEVMSLLLWARL